MRCSICFNLRREEKTSDMARTSDTKTDKTTQRPHLILVHFTRTKTGHMYKTVNVYDYLPPEMSFFFTFKDANVWLKRKTNHHQEKVFFTLKDANDYNQNNNYPPPKITFFTLKEAHTKATHTRDEAVITAKPPQLVGFTTHLIKDARALVLDHFAKLCTKCLQSLCIPWGCLQFRSGGWPSLCSAPPPSPLPPFFFAVLCGGEGAGRRRVPFLRLTLLLVLHLPEVAIEGRVCGQDFPDFRPFTKAKLVNPRQDFKAAPCIDHIYAVILGHSFPHEKIYK